MAAISPTCCPACPVSVSPDNDRDITSHKKVDVVVLASLFDDLVPLGKFGQLPMSCHRLCQCRVTAHELLALQGIDEIGGLSR